jgi:hypothetical protein
MFLACFSNYLLEERVSYIIAVGVFREILM